MKKISFYNDYVILLLWQFKCILKEHESLWTASFNTDPPPWTYQSQKRILRQEKTRSRTHQCKILLQHSIATSLTTTGLYHVDRREKDRRIQIVLGTIAHFFVLVYNSSIFVCLRLDKSGEEFPEDRVRSCRRAC